jgi:hypothetical protein
MSDTDRLITLRSQVYGARQMQKKLMRQFRDRWQAVAAVEAEEQKAASIALRWKQLNSIVHLAADLNLPISAMDNGEEAVWQRWSRLKERYESR